MQIVFTLVMCAENGDLGCSLEDPSKRMSTAFFLPLLCLQEQAAADNCRGLNEQEGGAHDAGCFPIDTFAWGSIVLGKFLDISSMFDRRLSIGASIACCIEAPSATN